jgi:hypothetical protein
MALELYDGEERLIPIHPALDVADDTLYVTVQVRTKDKGIQSVILTSDCEMIEANEWERVARDRGLLPLVDVKIDRTGPRWNSAAILGLLDGTLQAPGWRETYDAIHQALDDRLQVRDERYLTVLTLYCMMSYFHPLFDFLPLLHLRGPAESGKSRAGAVIGHLAFNGVTEGSPTAATLFRRAHEGRYTQVVAEGDHLAELNSGAPFVRQLQSGCSRAEATVEVAEGKGQYKPVTYQTFSLRVVISTREFGSQPLRSRRIRLDLVKIPQADETTLRRSIDDAAVWAPLRDHLYRLQLLKWREVGVARDALKKTWRGAGAPTGRTFEKWLPLAAIAQLVGADVLEEVRELAGESQEEQQQDAETMFEALLMKFAGWMVHGDKETRTTRKALYEMFLMAETAFRGPVLDDSQPTWAKETNTPVTVGQLRKWVRGEQTLVREMKRLNLLPATADHTRDGNVYVLDGDHIRATISAYMGGLTVVEDGAATHASATRNPSLRHTTSANQMRQNAEPDIEAVTGDDWRADVQDGEAEFPF